jgi:hypothetical protein
MLGSSWVSAYLATSQEGLSSLSEWVNTWHPAPFLLLTVRPNYQSTSPLCLIFTLKMVSAMHNERVEQFEHTAWPDPASQSYESDKDCANQRRKNIFIVCILLRDQTNPIVIFRLRNSKTVYPFNCSLIITTRFDHPTGHHQVIQYCNWFDQCVTRRHLCKHCPTRNNRGSCVFCRSDWHTNRLAG